MILDELVLHDFGVYGGRQTLVLTPAGPDRPVILVGGLNGGGKTTLLEALQLCLYGAAAPAANRTPGGYVEHLRRRIHRGSGAREAGLELAFRHTSEGVERSWRVVRSWRAVGTTCRETLEVLRDGVLDRLATENWAEQVEEFMPARIASIFLFDGEKVEAYADPEEAPALVASAVQNLLGLDVVERLSADLAMLERRRRAERGGADQAISASAEVGDVIEELRSRRLERQREVASLNDAVDRAARDFRQADERFRREGGGLYERRAAIEADAASAARARDDAERVAREVAGGSAPLLMVADLLEAATRRDRDERAAAASARMVDALDDEHAAMLALAPIARLGAAVRRQIEEALAARRSTHAERASAPTHLDLDDDARLLIDGLASGGLADVRAGVADAVGAAVAARARLGDAADALDAVPAGEAVEGLQDVRASLADLVGRLEAERTAAAAALEGLDREIEVQREREARLAEHEAAERHRGEDAERQLLHSTRVRGTLHRFREAVVRRHVGNIERLVLESFRALVRKPDLVSGLRIDPATFALTLVSGDGAELGPGQLSAGERQLLAVALLWGMARASGRPLPTIIDTPLGRLDSEHRTRLVERYFPHASHQVVLLSTDEEISGGYHDALRPFIGRSYHLAFDADARRTVIEEGYLADGGMRRVA